MPASSTRSGKTGQPPPTPNCLQMRAKRFRLKAGCVPWLAREGTTNTKTRIEALLGPQCVSQNSSRPFGRDLTKSEQKDILASNEGRNPERSKKAKRTREKPENEESEIKEEDKDEDITDEMQNTESVPVKKRRRLLLKLKPRTTKPESKKVKADQKSEDDYETSGSSSSLATIPKSLRRSNRRKIDSSDGNDTTSNVPFTSTPTSLRKAKKDPSRNERQDEDADINTRSTRSRTESSRQPLLGFQQQLRIAMHPVKVKRQRTSNSDDEGTSSSDDDNDNDSSSADDGSDGGPVKRKRKRGRDPDSADDDSDARAAKRQRYIESRIQMLQAD